MFHQTHTDASADPVNAETYEANAYLAQLQALDADVQAQLVEILPEKRSLAESSASDLVELIGTMEAHGICTIFTETTVSDSLAQTVAAELSSCDDVQVLPLYTGALGPTGSDADSYTGMFRANIDTILEGLR